MLESLLQVLREVIHVLTPLVGRGCSEGFPCAPQAALHPGVSTHHRWAEPPPVTSRNPLLDPHLLEHVVASSRGGPAPPHPCVFSPLCCSSTSALAASRGAGSCSPGQASVDFPRENKFLLLVVFFPNTLTPVSVGVFTFDKKPSLKRCSGRRSGIWIIITIISQESQVLISV